MVSRTGRKTRVRLIGLPTDSHSSFLRGAAAAPAAIRAALCSDHGNMAAESGSSRRRHPRRGCRRSSARRECGRRRAHPRRRRAARSATASCPCSSAATIWSTNPIVAGIAAARGPVNILHFDAHPDLYEDFDGDPLSHARPSPGSWSAAARRGWSRSESAPLNRHCREQAQKFGVETVEMRDFAPATVPIPEAPLYISIDLDALDPAFAPGVSHHEPGGLSRPRHPVGAAPRAGRRSSAPTWSNIIRRATSTA